MADLVVMEGEQTTICELLGMDESDSRYIKRYLSNDEKIYLNCKYPEYMGAIPAIIAKIASVGVSIGKGIAGAVKKRREQKNQQSKQKQAEEQAKIAQYQYMMQLQAAEALKKKQQNNMLLMAAIPLILGMFMLSRQE